MSLLIITSNIYPIDDTEELKINKSFTTGGENLKNSTENKNSTGNTL